MVEAGVGVGDEERHQVEGLSPHGKAKSERQCGCEANSSGAQFRWLSARSQTALTLT